MKINVTDLLWVISLHNLYVFSRGGWMLGNVPTVTTTGAEPESNQQGEHSVSHGDYRALCRMKQQGELFHHPLQHLHIHKQVFWGFFPPYLVN